MSELIIDLATRLAVNPTMVLRVESDDCALLFDPDNGRVHVLNPVAVAVWKRLDGRLTLEEVVAGLGEEFDEMGPAAGAQVVALARSLAELGAVGLLSEPS
jgi:hypothetical protein